MDMEGLKCAWGWRVREGGGENTREMFFFFNVVLFGEVLRGGFGQSEKGTRKWRVMIKCALGESY